MPTNWYFHTLPVFKIKRLQDPDCVVYTFFLRRAGLCCLYFIGKDSCSGDSGGPLIVRNSSDGAMYLKGIVSFGTKKCGKGIPGNKII